MTAYELLKLIKKDVGDNHPLCASKEYWNFSKTGKETKFKLWVDEVIAKKNSRRAKIFHSNKGWKNLHEQYLMWRKS